jgi:hypothetical protein
MTPINMEELKELIVDLTNTVHNLANVVGDLRVDVATSSTQQKSLIEHVKGMEERFNKEVTEAFALARQVGQELKEHKKDNSASHTRLKLDMARQDERVSVHKNRWEIVKSIAVPLLLALLTGIGGYLLAK